MSEPNFNFIPDKNYPSPCNTDKLVAEIATNRMRVIEMHLIGNLEMIEGRVPSDAEVKQHCEHLIFPDGHEEYLWKEQVIISIPRDACSFSNGEFQFKIQSRFKPYPPEE